MVGICEHDNNP